MLLRRFNSNLTSLAVLSYYLCAFIILANAIPAYAEDNTVVVRPVEIQDILVNPGMGITTFQRFNGDALNPRFDWSERGPETELQQAATNPEFPDSSIAYLRWYWDAIEPAHGDFRWNIIDLALKEAREHHQKLAIRLMPYAGIEGSIEPLPAWYRNSGARRANKPTDKDGSIWQPDFSDPLYLKYWGELVAAAGKRYDGNPYLDSVDISSIGYWGEGWSPYMPPFPVQKKLIDIWLKAFPHTHLLMNFAEQRALTYGTEHGAGWRFDCLGDMSVANSRSPEMLDLYPEQIVHAGIQNVWQHSPVSMETCGTPWSWKKQGFDVSYILSEALRWHVSSVNLKSSPIPPDWKDKFEHFERRMGYRFALRRLEYPKTVRPGEMMPIHMWWVNEGVAPIYREYWLAVELRSANGTAIIRVPANIQEWLPGDAMVDDSLYVPDNLAPGTYQFRVAMLDPRTHLPAIRFGIQGRQPDGWYNMGFLTIEK